MSKEFYISEGKIRVRETVELDSRPLRRKDFAQALATFAERLIEHRRTEDFSLAVVYKEISSLKERVRALEIEREASKITARVEDAKKKI